MKKLIFILLLCITTSAFGQLRQKPMHGLQINKAHPLGDPVAFWPFNEGSGNIVQDSSGNNNTGAGTGTFWLAGKFGSALDFTGGGSDDKLDCGNKVGTLGATALTQIIWIKFDTLPTGGAVQVHLMGRWGDGVVKRVIACRIVDSTTARLLTGNGVSALDSDVTMPAISANTWYQMAYVYNAGVGNFYLNGINCGAFAGLHTVLAASSSVNYTIGVDADGFGDLDGQVDNALVYNRALTSTEIAQLYREPFCMFEGDLTVAQMYDYSGAPPAPSSQFIMIQRTAIPLSVIILIAISPVFRKWKSKYSMMT